MKITADVVRDLLPAYLSGEATADTRALVEDAAARDPGIARIVESARTEYGEGVPGSRALRSATIEHQMVARLRAVLRRRTWTLALAIFFTIVPLTFAFHDGRVTFLMLRDEPGSRLLWLAAIYLWFDYGRQARKLRV